MDGQNVRHMPVVLGGVAPVPFRARRVEEYLRGRPLDNVNPAYAAGLALAGASPMAGNSHKVTVAINLTKQAIIWLIKNRARNK